VFAILALVGGMFFGWNWLDPVMGFAGAILVAVWAKGLIRDTSKVLLDAVHQAMAVHEEIVHLSVEIRKAHQKQSGERAAG
jgi:Co/Zn/Cd efflux system component